MVYSTTKIKNISEYFALISSFSINNTDKKNFFLLFRGQMDLEWNLQPDIARLDQRFKFVDKIAVEKKLISDFKALAISQIPNINQLTTWEVLTLARHHGVPTRLLDWSRNPLVALWFSLREKPISKNGRVVWVLHPNIHDMVDIEANPFEIALTKVLKPNRISERVAAQSSWFTSHAIDKNEKGYIPLDKYFLYMGRMYRILIPEKERINILLELDNFGISDQTLFPDLDGIGRYIRAKSILDFNLVP